MLAADFLEANYDQVSSIHPFYVLFKVSAEETKALPLEVAVH
jgi:hypothetical protein